MPGEIQTLKKAQLDLLVHNSKLPVLIDFWGKGCTPCKMLDPTIEELAREYKNKIHVCKVNITDNFDISMEYNIRSIPTIVLMIGGKLGYKIIGFHNKSEILKLIESFI